MGRGGSAQEGARVPSNVVRGNCQEITPPPIREAGFSPVRSFAIRPTAIVRDSRPTFSKRDMSAS